MAPTRTALFTFLCLFAVVAGETCYYPDGSTDSGHFACSSGGTSVCCAEGFQCLSNGLCNDYRYENFERVMRGGCTDKNWGDGCPQKCTSVWPQGDETVYLCGNGKFCCGVTEKCCNDSDADFFDFGSPQFIAIAGKTQAPATSVPNEEKEPEQEEPQSQSQPQPQPQPTSKAVQEQPKTQEQEQEQATKASSQPTQVVEQDEPQETPSRQPENAPATTEAKASSAEQPVPEATDAPSTTSKADNSEENTTNTDATRRPSTTPSGGSTASSPSGSLDAVSPAPGSASGPTATNTIINNITTPAPPNNTVAIAVGVGVGVAVLLFLFVLAGCWYMRRKRRGPSLRSRNIFEIGDSAMPAVGAEKRRTPRNPWGRGSGMVYEMDGGPREVELEGGLELKEMHGDSVREGAGVDKKWPGMFK
ncbi:hypothetical protein BU23DRAFT_16652 [Bimuria novae-zelandiae CBS 107.79]|uniref:Mid2 domain-containing protein n=1 Tax=Bimuria novae-zelandiae CBS 107.79 TaxID=1447943 RepID=A0A6A5ULK8_9PLEO|nr:hypothetical protein BU23DRAFT_16652 [Bimuria novae-zelandiae CBS 107.79]